MTTFDSFLFGSGALSIIIFFLTNTIRKKKNKNNKCRVTIDVRQQ